MKKLLIFMLVLGLASFANAAMTLEISVDGDKDPVDSQIFLFPSETLELDIWTTADITAGVGEGFWALTCETADGTISGGKSLFPQETGIVIYDDAVGNGVPVPAGENGVWGMIALATIDKVPAGSVIYDDIVFHCEWYPNDVLVTLWETDGTSVWPLDTVTIHQIPEPTTMLLLGLGGLLLRRRK